MSEMNRDKIISKSKETYNTLFYEASRLTRQIELLDIDETEIKKEDVIQLEEAPTLEYTVYGKIYSYNDKLYKKVSTDTGDKILCYTDIFLELASVNNKLVQLSDTLDDLEASEEEE